MGGRRAGRGTVAPSGARNAEGDGPLVLTLNAGSSSLKFALFRGDEPQHRWVWGVLDRIGTERATLSVEDSSGEHVERSGLPVTNHAGALDALLTHLAEALPEHRPDAAGHRVVHGGPRYREAAVVDGAMLAELRRIVPLAPHHLPAEIAMMELLAARFPEMPQVAHFDTAFHRGMPREATVLPIPRRYEAEGVVRYGFHGLSYAYLMEELRRVAGAEADGRVILAHLGNGASMAAVRGGRSVDTSMCFTPAAGLVMSTRSGDLDPGVVSYLARREGMSADRLDRLINRESGLLGVSELSSDMRDLLELEERDQRAAEAVSLFCYQARKFIGAYAAALGGVETLVFSGGIGEHAAAVRARICEGLEFLGIRLDEGRNASHDGVISAADAKVTVRVIRTDEEAMLARVVCRVLGRGVQTGG